MLGFTPDLHYYYYCADRVSFRNRINGLSSYVRDVLGRDPSDGSVFIFLSSSRKEMRLLCYDGNGYVLYCKRLSGRTRFRRPVADPATGSVPMRWDELVLLTEGVVRTEMYISGPSGESRAV